MTSILSSIYAHCSISAFPVLTSELVILSASSDTRYTTVPTSMLTVACLLSWGSYCPHHPLPQDLPPEMPPLSPGRRAKGKGEKTTIYAFVLVDEFGEPPYAFSTLAPMLNEQFFVIPSLTLNYLSLSSVVSKHSCRQNSFNNAQLSQLDWKLGPQENKGTG